MGHLFKAILIVLVLTCAMMAEAFWSSWRSEKSLSHSLRNSVAMGSGFIIYAGIDYLMIVPGADYLIA